VRRKQQGHADHPADLAIWGAIDGYERAVTRIEHHLDANEVRLAELAFRVGQLRRILATGGDSAAAG
jgi:hypothetical protein